MPARDSIWDHLPKWAGPERLYELMQLYRDSHRGGRALTKTEDNEFCDQLLCVVKMQFMQHRLHAKLNRVRADGEGVAQEAVLHLRKKAAVGLHLKAEGWRPMMTVMNTAVFRFCMTELVRAERACIRTATATDYFIERDSSGEESGLDATPGLARTKDLCGLSKAIDAAEDDAIGDIVCSAKKAQNLERLFKVLKQQIIRHQTPLLYCELPRVLRRNIGYGLHQIVVFRLLRAIRVFAGD